MIHGYKNLQKILTKGGDQRTGSVPSVLIEKWCDLQCKYNAEMGAKQQKCCPCQKKGKKSVDWGSGFDSLFNQQEI